jgi:hypothetical protein
MWKRVRLGLWTLALLTGLAALCVLPLWPFFGFAVEEYFSRIRFDSAAWKDAFREDGWNPVRLRMVDDLLSRHRLVGMSTEEIDELLGPATPTGHFGAYDYVYWLGPERSFISIDSEWLGLKFDGGRVVEASILRD